MKICHICDFLPFYHDHSGGAEYAAYRLMDLEKQYGHDVWAITSSFDHEHQGNFQVHQVPTMRDFLGARFEFYLNGIKWYMLQWDPLVSGPVKDLLKRLRPDLVHFHNIQFLGLSLIPLVMGLGIPSCLSIYDYWYFCPLTSLMKATGEICRDQQGLGCGNCVPHRFKTIQRLLLPFRRLVFERYLRQVPAFLVLSYSSKRILEDFGYGDRLTEVVHLVMEMEGYDTAGDPGEAPVLVYVGWLQKRKGFHVLLEAMPSILGKHPDAKLYALGGESQWRDEYPLKMRQMVADKGLGESVVFLGKVEHATVLDMLRKARIVLVPEQWENMSPVIVAESMLMGRPVVGSRIGGIPEFIIEGETGFLVEMDDAAGFAQRVNTLLGNYHLCRQMGAKAKEKARKLFDEREILSKVERFYQDLVKHPMSPAFSVKNKNLRPT